MLVIHTWLALLWLWVGTAGAEVLRWEGPVPPGHVVLIEVLYLGPAGRDGSTGDDEELAARVLSSDGTSRSQAGWRPDLDPRPDQVRLELPDLWLGPGSYVQRVTVGDSVQELALQPQLAAPRVVMAIVPDGATGVRALRFTQGSGTGNGSGSGSGGGHDGWAFAPAHDNVAFLALGDGAWSATVTGPPGDSLGSAEVAAMTPSDVAGSTTSTLRFGSPPPSRRRTPGPAHRALIGLGLLPVTSLILGTAAWAALRAWHQRQRLGLVPAVVVASLISILALSGALPDLGSSILMGGASFTDPPTSAALSATLSDSVWRLSANSLTFGFPEGHSWLIVGPSWLGYLPVLPLVGIFSGLVAHNAGVMLGVALLFLTAWGLARSLGAGPLTAMLAGAGAAFAPTIWTELDALSLDRITLFTVPVFVLCLERAARLPGWRWPVATGVALAAVFYGQVYYGLYLAAAVPIMVLWRLVGPAPLARLGRLALAGTVAAALLLPGLLALRIGTANTVYTTGYAPHQQTLLAQLRDEGRPLTQPVSTLEAETYVATYDRRHGDDALGPRSGPRSSPRDMLLLAVTNSIDLDELRWPSASFAGHGAAWPLALLGVLFAASGGPRWAALRLTLDTALLSLLALGPLALDSGGEVHGLMPYYWLVLATPGFDQLKHPDRYMMLAATLSACPVALGLEGIVQRGRRALGLCQQRPASRAFKGGVALSTALLTGLVSLLMVTLTLKGQDDPPGFLRLDVGDRMRQRSVDLSLDLPQVQPVPRSTALMALQPGPALFLPVVVPTPLPAYLAALQAHLPMVNDAPYGTPVGGSHSSSEGPTKARSSAAWIEENALLSRAAWLTGTDRPRRLLEPGSGRRARQDLQDQGLAYLVLVPHALAGPELLDAAVIWLDANFQRLGQDDQVMIWSVAAPNGPQ